MRANDVFFTKARQRRGLVDAGSCIDKVSRCEWTRKGARRERCGDIPNHARNKQLGVAFWQPLRPCLSRPLFVIVVLDHRPIVCVPWGPGDEPEPQSGVCTEVEVVSEECSRQALLKVSICLQSGHVRTIEGVATWHAKMRWETCDRC